MIGDELFAAMKPGATLINCARAGLINEDAMRTARAEKAAALEARLRAFAGRSQTFAMPNKKAAYELTHIIFYLSDYGRQIPELPDGTLKSLHFTGLLAFLMFIGVGAWIFGRWGGLGL